MDTVSNPIVMDTVSLLWATLCCLSPELLVPAAREILIVLSEMLMRDCPWTCSGNAALAAAVAMNVPRDERAKFIRASEKRFTHNDDIRNQKWTSKVAFAKWLDTAKSDPLLNHYIERSEVPLDKLPARMVLIDKELLGEKRCNVPLCELIRWVAKGVPRPQWASLYLIATAQELLAGMKSVPLPAGWAANMQSSANRTESLTFFYVGQNVGSPVTLWTAAQTWSLQVYQERLALTRLLGGIAQGQAQHKRALHDDAYVEHVASAEDRNTRRRLATEQRLRERGVAAPASGSEVAAAPGQGGEGKTEEGPICLD